jgi:chromosome partitioning protein
MRSIAIVNSKGGVAKTTTAVNLAHGIARTGKKVLLIDLDAQGGCSSLLGLEQEQCVFDLLISDPAQYKPAQALRLTGRDNLTLIPGNRRTATAQNILMIEKRSIEYLRDVLKSFDFDYLIIDTSPSIGELAAQAIWMSNYYLIPTACDFLSSEGVYRIQETATALIEVKKSKTQLLGLLPTYYDTTKESATILAELKSHFGDHVLEPIHRATILRESGAAGQTIFEFDKRSRAAAEYQNLVDYVLEVNE